MTINNQPYLEKTTWKKVRDAVFKVNPQLATEIDSLDPNDNYPLFKVCYPFASKLLDSGQFKIASEQNQLHSIHDSCIENSIKEQLGYSQTIPLGIVLSNSIELYLTENNRVIPYKIFNEGNLFSLRTTQEESQSSPMGHVWNITAGARSLMMLPKISDAAFYKRVQRQFGLNSQIPKSWNNQWDTFKELSEHSEFMMPWKAEVLYFSQKWFNHSDDNKWRSFHYFLIKQSWNETDYLRNQVVTDFAFSCALADNNLKPNPYLFDIIKHLYLIGIGAYPAFIIAKDESAAPIRSLQHIFNEVYGLRYAPTMLHPGYLSSKNPKQTCYFSLEVPTTVIFSPRSRQHASKLEDLREIQFNLEKIKQYFLEDKLKLEGTPIYNWAQRINYDYLHSEPDEKDTILNSNTLRGNDDALIEEESIFKNKPICTSSPFLRGCVKITNKVE